MFTKSIFLLLCLNFLRNVESHGGERGEMHNRNNFPANRAHSVITREKICNYTSNTFAGLSGKDDHPPDAEFVCEVCTNSTTFLACAGNASRCFPRIDIENKPKIPTAFCSCINSDLELNTSYITYVSNGGLDVCTVAQRQGGIGKLPWGYPGGPGGNRRPGGPGDNRRPGGPGDNRHPGEHRDKRHSGEHRDNRHSGEHRDNRHSGEHRDNRHPMAVNITGFMQTLNQSDPTLLAKLECCASQKTGLFDSSGSANVTAWHAKADLKPDGTASTAIKTAIDQCATDTTIGCNVHNFMHCIMRTCFTAIQNSSG